MPCAALAHINKFRLTGKTVDKKSWSYNGLNQPNSPVNPRAMNILLISSILLAGGRSRSSGCVQLTQAIATRSFALPLQLSTSQTVALILGDSQMSSHCSSSLVKYSELFLEMWDSSSSSGCTVDFLMSEIHTWVPPSYIYKLIPLLVFVGIEYNIWREWKSFYNGNFFM